MKGAWRKGKTSNYVAIAVFALLLISTVCVWWYIFHTKHTDELFVTFLDVGQGDAIFIETGSGKQVLIDGGNGRAVLRELGKEMSFFDRSIDVVIATHPDLDHIGGLPYVFRRYSIGMYIESRVEGDSSAVDELRESLLREGLEAIFAKRGMYLSLDDEVSLEVMFPDRDVAKVDPNTGSVVAKLVYKDTSFLFTGDAPSGIEAYLAGTYGTQLKSDVLKLGHHGSKTSSSELFLGVVNPHYAIVSAGCDNQYGHPNQIVLERLRRFEIETIDTCTEGSITFVTNGTELYIQ